MIAHTSRPSVRFFWIVPGLLLVAGTAEAAPPVGWAADRLPAVVTPRSLETGTGTTDSGISTTSTSTTDSGISTTTTDSGTTGTDTTSTVAACPPEAPYQLGPTLCGDQTIIDQIESGWEVTVDADGQVTLIPPPTYDAGTGQWGSFDAATQGCNPTIEVKLKQAALAGSQVTRAISDRQMDYPQTDPIEVVNNPRKDGAGGVCTIDLFAFDLGRLLGSTYEQIRNMIDQLSQLSVDSLFGAGCKVVNTLFGDLQSQLLQDLSNHAPVTGFQQFLSALRVGYITPLTSLTRYGNGTQASTATVPGIVTTQPLQVSYVPGRGYVYGVDLGEGNVLVVRVSATPLVPADAVH